MNAKKIIVEIICLVLVLSIFYEGIYKIAYLRGYASWLRHAPLLKSTAPVLTYVIPVGEIVLSLLFLSARSRMVALNATIVVSVIFILYVICAHLFTHRLFWPFDAPWNRPAWMQKLLIALGWSWLAFAAIILSRSGISLKRFSSNLLRNTPVKTS
jgi:hypothetical protein